MFPCHRGTHCTSSSHRNSDSSRPGDSRRLTSSFSSPGCRPVPFILSAAKPVNHFPEFCERPSKPIQPEGGGPGTSSSQVGRRRGSPGDLPLATGSEVGWGPCRGTEPVACATSHCPQTGHVRVELSHGELLGVEQKKSLHVW